MNGRQMMKRHRRDAFMRETLDRNIQNARLAGNTELAEILSENRRKYDPEYYVNRRTKGNDNRTFWGEVAKLKMVSAAKTLWRNRRRERLQRKRGH